MNGRGGRARQRRPARGGYERLDGDHDNLRAALRHAVAAGDGDIAVALVAPTVALLAVRGKVPEGRAFCAVALALDGARPRSACGRPNGAGILAGEQGDFAAAREHVRGALALAP